MDQHLIQEEQQYSQSLTCYRNHRGPTQSVCVTVCNFIVILNRLLFNGIQSERGNQQDGFELAHENLAMHLDRLESVGF